MLTWLALGGAAARGGSWRPSGNRGRGAWGKAAWTATSWSQWRGSNGEDTDICFAEEVVNDYNWLFIGFALGCFVTLLLVGFILWRIMKTSPAPSAVGALPLRDGASEGQEAEDEYAEGDEGDDQDEWYAAYGGTDEEWYGHPCWINIGVYRRRGEALEATRLRAVPMVYINDMQDSVVYLHQGFRFGRGSKWHLYPRCPMEDLPGRQFGLRNLDIVDAWVAKSFICSACFRQYVEQDYYWER